MNLKRILLVITLILVAYGLYYLRFEVQKIKTETISTPTPIDKLRVSYATVIKSRSLFVPYWQLNDGFQSSVVSGQYDRYIYFGVEGTADGIDTTEPGYKKLNAFIESTQNSRWLAIRMMDSKVNDEVLGSRKAQLNIINDSVKIAKRYGFVGLVLDFEYVSLFGDKKENVTAFYKLFAENTKSNNLKFASTLYGDVFYRGRPYNVEEIAKLSDEVMIMAYDLHKSRGEPGPNFPLNAGKNYGYGYDLLFKDLEKYVAAEKLTIIFGMYGYDWKVDEQKRPITKATSLTTAQITEDYPNNCDVLHCTIVKDSVSAETEINYLDKDGRYHVIWFESEESARTKEEFIRLKGVEAVAYWAYGYF